MADQTQYASADRGHRSVRGSWRAGRHRRSGNRSLPEAQAKEEPAGGFGGPNFSLRGTRQQNLWPEKQERSRMWVAPRKAAKLVKKSGLRRAIKNFGDQD